MPVQQQNKTMPWAILQNWIKTIVLNWNAFYKKLTLYSAVSEMTFCLCGWIWRLFHLLSKKTSFFHTCAWIQTHIISFCGLLLNLSHFQGRKANLLLFLFKWMHIIFEISLKIVSPQTLCLAEAVLSAVLNTRGYLSHSPLFPSRSPDLSVISCHSSTSPPANGICPCYAMVANSNSIVVNAHYSAVFAHLKQHRSPLMNSQPRTKSVEHPQTPFCCPQERGWPHQQLGPQLKLAGKVHPKVAAGSKMQEDPVRLTPTKLEK